MSTKNKFYGFKNQQYETEELKSDETTSSDESYVKWMEERIVALANNSTPWNRDGELQLQDINMGFFKGNKKYIRKIGNLLVKHKFLDISVTIWDHCHNTDVKKEQYLNAPAYELMKDILWKYSDLCTNFCEAAFQQEKAVERCMREFSMQENAVENLKSDHHKYFVKATLIFLHNILCLCNDNRTLIRRNHGIQRILQYHESDSPMIKAQAMLVLAYCVDEKENEQIFAESGVISFIVELLKTAMYSPGHSTDTYSFTVVELLVGLSKLALNDNNKVSIVKAGILPLLLVTLGEDFSAKEHVVAMNCLWTLSFHENIKSQIKEEPGLLKVVHQFAEKADALGKKMKRSCDGIVFNVEGSYTNLNDETKETNGNEPYIMLSYQWNVQPTILELRTKLKESGYNVWMDVDNMEGSILSAMAAAIENASVVVIAMTEKYKNSNACRTESEYSYKLRKPIIPLMLEPKYKPDGWLGAFLGMKLYFDITDKDWKETKFDNLLHHITLKMEVEPTPKTTTEVVSAEQGSNKSTNLLRNWTKDEVASWAKESGIENLVPILSSFDGQALEGLSKMLKRSPDVYYTRIQTELSLNFIQMLQFTSALKSL